MMKRVAEICFSPDITPHLLDLKNRFVTYRLELVKGLRSIYSANLLRLLMTQKYQETCNYT